MRPHHRELVDHLRAAGAARVRLIHASTRHPRIIFSWQGVEHSMPVAGSPSDWRATRQAIAALRRMLREAGAP
jgi:hypothetical protein